MITLDAIRAAVQAPNPYTQMDTLIRTEMAAGRKVKEIFDAINPLVDTVLDIPGLTEDGEEAFLGTLDALTGNCRSDQCYYDPPNTSLPTEEEIAALPRWARVAFAARCAWRVFPLFTYHMPNPSESYREQVWKAILYAEQSAASAGRRTQTPYHPDPELTTGLVGEPVETEYFKTRYRGVPWAVGRAALAAALGVARATIVTEAASLAAEAAQPLADVIPIIRRDFDHLAQLARWQKWTDDTPVPPDVFGPLWPEGPPPGWPADPDVPQRTDLPVELLSAARVLEQMTEDEAVNLFNAVNAYYIARTGDRLTMEDLRPWLPAAVPAEV